MKKLHLTFGIIAGILTIGAIIFATIWSVNIGKDPYTSFPWWSGFAFMSIYYAMGLGAYVTLWLVTWLIARLILRCKTCKKQNKLL